MPERVIENSVLIQCSPRELYDYVTQPWRWHEWHPSSASAKASADVMSVGERFSEVIHLCPLPWLPLVIQRKTEYRVEMAERGCFWQVSGVTDSGALTIRYDLTYENGVDESSGTRFNRRLKYRVSGTMQLLEPLLYPQMKRLSLVALENLRNKLER